jgi:HlyD family secretion protein
MTTTMKTKQRLGWAAGAAVLLLGAAGAAWMARAQQAPAPAPAATAKPALSVTVTTPQPGEWPVTLAVNGNIAAWQEATIGAEVGGYPLTAVAVNVGDAVKRGQVLAQQQSDTVRAEAAQVRAALVEAEAAVAEAKANAERARQLQPSGAISAQQIAQYLTAEQTGNARVQAVRAQLDAVELKLRKTQVRAPDDGIVSSRSAAVGAVPQAGQELFKLIRQGRLEWRAEVPAAELKRVSVGQAAILTTPGGTKVEGRVRMVAPTVDAQSRNAIVYVDLKPAPDSDARAGMFARGEFRLGTGNALTLPAAAVLLREGYHVVMRVDAQSRVAQTKVEVGQRVGDRIEVRGLAADARVVAQGAAFLTDGDLVRVVTAPSVASSNGKKS